MRASLRHRGSICGWLAAVLVAQLLSERRACLRADGRAGAAGCIAHAWLPRACGRTAGRHGDAAVQGALRGRPAIGQQQPAGAADVPQAPFLSAPLLRVLDTATAEALAAEIPAAVASGPPAGSPPLYLSLLVLRN